MDSVSFHIQLCDLLGANKRWHNLCPDWVTVCGLELSTKLHVPCVVRPDGVLTGTLPRALVLEIVRGQAPMHCLAPMHALDGFAATLCALFAPNILFVLLRHTPGKNMRVGVVCLACDTSGGLTVYALWNGSTLESRELSAPRPLQPLSAAINNRHQHPDDIDFWDVGLDINDAVSENMWGNRGGFNLNVFTYCTLGPWVYECVGHAHVLLERHTVPRVFAAAYVGLARALGAACMATQGTHAAVIQAGEGIQPNAARPSEAGEEHELGLFAKLAAWHACPTAEPRHGEVGGVAQAMTYMDAVLALLNKLLIDIDGRGQIYRSDNEGEDISLVVSQHVYMGAFDAAAHPFFAMRDCEYCAQVFTQVCNTEAAQLRALAAQLCPGLRMRVHLIRVVYMQRGEPLCHTLTGVLYTHEVHARGDTFCELRLCENTCRQLICDEPSPILVYLFARSGNIRRRDEACEHYMCVQWIGEHMAFELRGGVWFFGAHPYLRYCGAPVTVSDMHDLTACLALPVSDAPRLVLLDPLFYFSQRALLPVYSRSRGCAPSSCGVIPGAWQRTAAMMDLTRSLEPRLLQFYDENTAETTAAAGAAVAYLQQCLKRDGGVDSPWLAVLAPPRAPKPVATPCHPPSRHRHMHIPGPLAWCAMHCTGVAPYQGPRIIGIGLGPWSQSGPWSASLRAPW